MHKGEEIANIEAMKMETAILAPLMQVVEIAAKVNDIVKEGQLLFVLEEKNNKRCAQAPLTAQQNC